RPNVANADAYRTIALANSTRPKFRTPRTRATWMVARNEKARAAISPKPSEKVLRQMRWRSTTAVTRTGVAGGGRNRGRTRSGRRRGERDGAARRESRREVRAPWRETRARRTPKPEPPPPPDRSAREASVRELRRRRRRSRRRWRRPRPGA